MIEEVLDTKVKMRIARLFAYRKEPLSVSDVARTLKISKSRSSECLRELNESGFLIKKAIGRSMIYSLAPSSLAQSIAVSLNQDAILLSNIEKDLISRIRGLKPASVVLFGSALNGLKVGSDIDFLLIHENMLREEEVYQTVGELTERFGFHVSILPMSLKKFREKARNGEEFILNIVASHKLIYGKDPEELIW
jgi:predicted nucleotidyltransferase